MGKYERFGGKAGGAARRGAPRYARGGTVLGIFLGLVVGVMIAFGVVWYLNKAPLPFMNKYEGAPKPEKDKAPAAGAACRPSAWLD